MPDEPDARGLVRGDDGRLRCAWHSDKPLYRAYHDTEWGRPVADERRIFEKICIEGFGAGLSFLTILNKREALRAAFDHFDAAIIAGYGQSRVDALMQNAAIIRNRRKIESVINNARRVPATVAEFGSLAALLWSVEPAPESRPQRLDPASFAALTETPESRRLSRLLRERGWSFVGPVSLYAMMQSLGVVNDHLEGCYCRAKCAAARARFTPPQPDPPA